MADEKARLRREMTELGEKEVMLREEKELQTMRREVEERRRVVGGLEVSVKESTVKAADGKGGTDGKKSGSGKKGGPLLFFMLFIMLTCQVDGPPSPSPKQDLGEAPRNLQSVDWTERLQKRSNSEAPGNVPSVNGMEWLQKRSTRHQKSRDARKNGLKDPKQDLGEAPRNLQSVDWTERLQKRSNSEAPGNVPSVNGMEWLQKRSTRHQKSRDARKNGLKDNKQVLGEAPGNLQSVNGMDSEAPRNLQSVIGMDSEAPGNLQSVNGMDSEAPGNLQSVNGMDSEAPGNLQSVNGMDSEAPGNLQSVNGMDSEAPGNLQSVNGMDSEAPGNLQSVNGMDSEAPGNLQSVNRRERLQKRSIRHQRSRKNGLKEQNICHLEDIPNGEPKDHIYEYAVGEEASISCLNYYMIDGPQKVKCLPDGTMTKRPTCVTVHYCSKFAELLNGIVNQTKWPKPGETANFNCNNGYRLNGVSTTTCQLDGNWDLGRIPVCEERKIVVPATEPPPEPVNEEQNVETEPAVKEDEVVPATEPPPEPVNEEQNVETEPAVKEDEGSGSSTNLILAICLLGFCICSAMGAVCSIILRKQKNIQLEQIVQLQSKKEQDQIKIEHLEFTVQHLQLEIQQQNHVKARLDETDEQRATGPSDLGIHVGEEPYPTQTQAGEVARGELGDGEVARGELGDGEVARVELGDCEVARGEPGEDVRNRDGSSFEATSDLGSYPSSFISLN